MSAIGVSFFCFYKNDTEIKVITKANASQEKEVGLPVLENEKQSEVVKIEKQTVSLKELEGTITNRYGIRDDIVRYIERNMPKGNPIIDTATFKFAAITNEIYYHTSEKDAMEKAQTQFIALQCLRKQMSMVEWDKFTDGINNMMNDTPERKKHTKDIDNKYFGWKIFTVKISDDEKLKIVCESGNY